MKTILYFQSTGKIAARQKLEGVYGYAKAHDVDVQVIEPSVTERRAAMLLEFWKPDGAIVECGAECNLFDPRVFDGIPVVFLDRDRKALPHSVLCVTHDSVATAHMAARELLRLNLPAYAYVPWVRPRFWSKDREKGFREALALNSRGYSRFTEPSDASNLRTLQRNLRHWLETLPTPVGIFAANDFMSAQVAAAASRIGRSIPGDIALIGVDNDELLCENTKPTLSSIMPNFREAGQKAAELLERAAAGRSTKATSDTFGPLQLVRRASTSRFHGADAEVSAALELIRRKACSGLKARDVFSCFSCTRRMAEIRFRNATGLSPLQAILQNRRTKADELISNRGLSRSFIASQCGYSSASSLGKFLSKFSS